MKKHSPVIDVEKLNSFYIEDPSLFPLFFDCVFTPVVVVCEKNSFDEVVGSFPVDHKGVVSVPFIKKPLSSPVVKTYHEGLFEVASARLSSEKEGVSLIVVDSRAVKEPLFSPKKRSPFIVGKKNTCFDSLLGFLKKETYEHVEAVSSPGEFVVRGGVVDIFSFGARLPFRYSFLDDSSCVFFFNHSSGEILKKEEFVSVLPVASKKTLGVLDVFSSFLLTHYYDGFLFFDDFKFCKSSLPSKRGFSVVEYEKFKYRKDSFPVCWEKNLLVKGAFYNDVYYLPLWFDDKYKKPSLGHVPLSGSLISGDYFVHSGFGVCKYLGLVSAGNQNEKILLKFEDGKMSLDVRFINRLSFYASASAEGVSLDFLNKTGGWNKRKSAAKKRASLYVESLFNSYLSREKTTKQKNVYDFELFAEFMSFFKYKDTEDQALAWNDICADLSSNKPMFRLLCGDVGFGKTELAMRAAFMVHINGGSVIVLAPTTILSQQLFHSFSDRFSFLGTRVVQASRLHKQSKSSINQFVCGEADILIGTHSILRDPGVLKRASLIVVDEEHRFGVKDKESILSFSPACDYLSMSATPIPRSLQLALSGARNISTLRTPPQSRKPIITNIYYYNKSILKQAVSFEVSRGGQVYIVDSSVNNVKHLHSLVCSLFPLFPSAVLYGSLDSKTINKTMGEFRNKKIKLLVSTVIVESGIDISSVNTIVINNAHTFGLAQLHQLRGRVGRSGVQSYAYLLVPKKTSITSSGALRLESIKKNSFLGAGYFLAMSDLSIRGAGDLFGYGQSGGRSVGFEFYSKLLSEAIKKGKGGGFSVSNVDVDFLEAYIPESFIASQSERAYYYRSVAECSSLTQVEVLHERAINLYGSLPFGFSLLFYARKISLLSQKTPVVSIKQSLGCFFVSCLPSKINDIVVFLEKVEGFLSLSCFDFKVVSDDSFLKFRFKYVGEDYYILLENFIKHLHA